MLQTKLQIISNAAYQAVVLLNDRKLWNDSIKEAAKEACETKSLCFASLDANVEGTKELLGHLEAALRKGLAQN